MNIDRILQSAPVIPVIVIEQPSKTRFRSPARWSTADCLCSR